MRKLWIVILFYFIEENLKDPLRIYSALIEYGDITAYKTYNKLSALV